MGHDRAQLPEKIRTATDFKSGGLETTPQLPPSQARRPAGRRKPSQTHERSDKTHRIAYQ